MIIKTVDDLDEALKHEFAWPGGYPTYFITADGGALSHKTVNEEREQIAEAIEDDDTDSGWRVVALDINWEDPDLHDDHSGERIPSAYAEDD